MRRKRIIVLGAFTLAALGGLTFAGMALRFKPLGAHTEWTVYFSEDSAIDKGARVFTSGFKVGFVNKVELVPLEEIFVVKTLEVEGIDEQGKDESGNEITVDGKPVYMTRSGTYTLKDPQYGKRIGQVAPKGARGGGTAAVRLNGRYIRATLSVNPDVTIWHGARVMLARGSILGRHSVNLKRGTPRHGADLEAGPDRPLFGEVEADLVEHIERFATSTENQVQGTIAMVQSAVGSIKRVTDKYEEGVLGHLLLEPEEYEDLSTALKSASTLGDDVKELGEFVRALREDYEKGEGLLQALVKDAETRKKFVSIVARVDEIANSLSPPLQPVAVPVVYFPERGGVFARLIHDQEQSDRFSETLVKLDETIAQFREASAQLNDTKGTLGMLINDEATKRKLTEFVANMEKVGDQLSAMEGSTLGRLINDDRIIRDLEAMVSEFREAGQVARENAPLGSLTSFTVLFFDVLN